MNIGIVCYPTYGGSGVVATELGNALARKGHSVHFITYNEPFRLDYFNSNISFHEVSFANYSLFQFPPYETALASRMVDVVKFEKLDLLHVHYAIPHASAAFIAKQILAEEGINLPVVTTLHGTDITLVGKQPSFSPVVAFSINQSDGVTTVSESLKNDTLEQFKIRRQIEVIPNFIDLKRFSKSNKLHFKKAIAPNDERVLIHVSNFRKVKRVEDVVHIFDRVSKEIPSKLLLVGDGPERQHIEAICRQLERCDDVRFLGKQEAVEELLAISDLFLMPSESESFGLAALEAMACEVPVIASDAGGLPEVIKHGVNGYLAPVGDTAEMAKLAIHLLGNDERLATFRAAAYACAKTYDIEKILPQYEAYYERIICASSK